jgi:hypothetical protein
VFTWDPNSSARHRSVQPSSSGRKAPVFAKSLSASFAELESRSRTQFRCVQPLSVGWWAYASRINRTAMPKNTTTPNARIKLKHLYPSI